MICYEDFLKTIDVVVILAAYNLTKVSLEVLLQRQSLANLELDFLGNNGENTD